MKLSRTNTVLKQGLVTTAFAISAIMLPNVSVAQNEAPPSTESVPSKNNMVLNNQLIAGVMADDVNQVRAALAGGADVNFNEGEALTSASFRGSAEVLQVLMQDKSLNLNARKGHALILAAIRGRNEAIVLLLDRGMNPNGFAKDSWPLGAAVTNVHIDTMRLLVQRGADVDGADGRALALAVLSESVESVAALIDLKADVNAGQGMGLRLAFEKGNLKIAQMLIEKGADPRLASTQDALGNFSKDATLQANPALKEIAALYEKRTTELNLIGPVKIAQPVAEIKKPTPKRIAPINFLLDNSVVLESTPKKYEVSASEEENRWNMAAAAVEGNLDTVKKFLDSGVHPDIGDGTVLISAAEYNHIEVVRLLLDRGANVNIDAGWPMIIAADNGSVAIVKLFLDRGIDPNLEAITDFLEQMDVVRKDPNFAKTRYSSPAHAEIEKMLRDYREKMSPESAPKQSKTSQNGFPIQKLG